jgi:DNA helicase-2/ATP-dependent DNA helicase PcrA
VTPTDEQLAIMAAMERGDNCMVEALAGCAKSTTIKLALQSIPKTKTTMILAFNKKIKDDMEADIKEMGLARPNLRILTMNGLGHAAIGKALRSFPEIDNDKIYKLAKDKGLRKTDLFDTIALVRQARLAGIVPRGTQGRSLTPDTDESWATLADDLDVDPILLHPARQVLAESVKAALAGTIDFDDQIYISTLIFGAYPQAHVVLVDEAQDLSPLNHLQIAKFGKCQLGVVGDPHQAIYAWRGADHLSMEHIRGLRQEWTDLPLTMTFRCPKAVVDRQRKIVPNFRAAESNLQGEILRLQEWRPEGGASSAILCRNNAPLLDIAFRLLRKKVPINYLGRDIGASLKRTYNKLSNHGKHSNDTVIAECQRMMEAEPEKADKYYSLIVILQSHDTVDEAMRFLGETRTNAISLATGHKAKGLEWSSVYHLNPWLIPSKWVKEMEPEEPPEPDDYYQGALARYQSALQQENNLRYVIETRTKNKLYFVNGDSLL